MSVVKPRTRTTPRTIMKLRLHLVAISSLDESQ